MKNLLQSKPLIIGAAIALAALIGVSVYLSQNTAEKLLSKGLAAESEVDTARAEAYYIKLSKKWSAKASGTGYWQLFKLYNNYENPLAAEMLIKSAEKECEDAMYQLAQAYLNGNRGGTSYDYVGGIEYDVAKAIALLEATKGYEADCDLAEIYIFEPGYVDYDKAAQSIKQWFDGSFDKRLPRARHLGAILMYMGKGGYRFTTVGNIQGLLDDASDGMASYYRGHCWMRQSISGSERLEFCINKALDYYQVAFNTYSCRYIDREELEQRIDILREFSDAQHKANDRDDLYGSDEYYWTGPVDSRWHSYRNGNDFNYDGINGNGIGAGSWPRNEELFCGEWRNGRCYHGVFVDAKGNIFTGQFDSKGTFKTGTCIAPNNMKTIF